MIKRILCLGLILAFVSNILGAEIIYPLPKVVTKLRLKTDENVKGYLICATEDGVVMWLNRGVYSPAGITRSARFVPYSAIEHFTIPRSATLKPLMIGALSGTGLGLLMIASASGDGLETMVAILGAEVLIAVGAGVGTIWSFIASVTPRKISTGRFMEKKQTLQENILFYDAIPAEIQTFIADQQSLKQADKADLLRP